MQIIREMLQAILIKIVLLYLRFIWIPMLNINSGTNEKNGDGRYAQCWLLEKISVQGILIQ